MRGRKKKPTELKLLQGNPGKRAINKKEPKPKGMPKCPPHLDKVAKKEWKRFAPILNKLGLLTEVDGTAFAAYCQQYSTWVTISLEIAKIREKKDALTVTDEDRLDNLILRQRQTLQSIRAFSVEFGMTPSSRGRIQVGAGEKSDPMDEFLNKGKNGKN